MGIIYKYLDNKENVVYVGITTRLLSRRHYEHLYYDDWCTSELKLYYVEDKSYSQTDLQTLESHFITKYKTYEYYNKSKANWGLCSFINDDNIIWEKYIETMLINNESKSNESKKITDYKEVAKRIKTMKLFGIEMKEDEDFSNLFKDESCGHYIYVLERVGIKEIIPEEGMLYYTSNFDVIRKISKNQNFNIYVAIYSNKEDALADYEYYKNNDIRLHINDKDKPKFFDYYIRGIHEVLISNKEELKYRAWEKRNPKFKPKFEKGDRIKTLKSMFRKNTKYGEIIMWDIDCEGEFSAKVFYTVKFDDGTYEHSTGGDYKKI